MELEYFAVDAFTREPFHGAQIAVVPDAGSLSTRQMQQISAELKLDETVFLTRCDADGVSLRVFAGSAETSVFGAPLIAVGHLLGANRLLELQSGMNDLQVSNGMELAQLGLLVSNGELQRVQYALQVTPRVDRFVPARSELAAFLSLSVDDLDSAEKFRPLLVACPDPYLVVGLKSLTVLRQARFDYSSWSLSSAPSMLAQEVLLVSTECEDKEANFHVRLVGPAIGVSEDPPVGSALAALACWLCEHDHIRHGTYPFGVERGSRQTRHSLLHVEMDNLGREQLPLRVSGDAAVVCRGSILLPKA